MDKRAFNRVSKELNILIGLELENGKEYSLSRITTINHILTQSALRELADLNPQWTEFDLLSKVLIPILSGSLVDTSTLYFGYELLARTASLEGKDNCFELHKKAVYYLALRNIEGYAGLPKAEIYFQLLRHERCCSLCSDLGGTFIESEEFLETMPIPLKACKRDDKRCACFPNAISERRFKRLLMRGAGS